MIDEDEIDDVDEERGVREPRPRPPKAPPDGVELEEPDRELAGVT